MEDAPAAYPNGLTYEACGPFSHFADELLPRMLEEQWLVPGLIPRVGVTILASAPKTGKTCFATALARAVATGGEFLGHKVEKQRIAWCAHEETRDHRAVLQHSMPKDAEFYIAYPESLVALDQPDRMEKRDPNGGFDDCARFYVFEHLQRMGAKLLVIDSLQSAIQFGNLSENRVARRVFEFLRGWATYLNMAVLVLHHTVKRELKGYSWTLFSDSAQILAGASTAILMDWKDGGPGEREIVLFAEGRHPVPPRTLRVRSRGVLDYRLIATCDRSVRVETLAERILACLRAESPLSPEDVHRRLGGPSSLVRVNLTDLAKRGPVSRRRVGRKTLYSIDMLA